MKKKRVENPKPPVQLFAQAENGEFKGQDIWFCGECRLFSLGSRAKEQAAECCKIRRCECGEELPEYYLKCRSCSSVERDKKMTLVEYKGGPLCDIDGDRYFENMEEVLDHYYHDDADDRPDFVHPCDELEWKGLSDHDVDSMLESPLCELFEGAEDRLVDVDGLKMSVRQWSEKQSIKYWQARTGEKVRITWELL